MSKDYIPFIKRKSAIELSAIGSIKAMDELVSRGLHPLWGSVKSPEPTDHDAARLRDLIKLQIKGKDIGRGVYEAYCMEFNSKYKAWLESTRHPSHKVPTFVIDSMNVDMRH